jgi:Protein of unknown function (DUF1553)/Protein of unknown function (DUF1549)/Planctomycete cytochrome C
MIRNRLHPPRRNKSLTAIPLRLALGLAAVALAMVPSLARTATKPLPKTVEFNRDVRLILSDKCFACHGPDRHARKAKLRLDQEASAKADRDGHPAIVPGHPERSELIHRINNPDPDDVMPPPEFEKKLSANEKAILKRWIAQGAVWEQHWAYLPPKRAPLPEVKRGDWPLNAIDHFILAKIEDQGLEPSPEAERRTLIRRLSLDVTGLPPTPAEVEAFVNDPSAGAYESLVDRLLRSPHYGERMAMPWLDAVRFADTVGYHGDQNQNIFPYRDYIIESFNENKPFDQFTVEQLAGDLLPHPTEEQLVATGFNRLNMMTREGGAQAKEYLAKYGADRVRTLSTTWLGSTMACCECHDHKFDPFTTKDFYSMEAFFADIKQWGVYADYNYTPNPELKGFDNNSPFPPEIEVDSLYLKTRRDRIRKKAETLLQRATAALNKTNAVDSAFQDWMTETRRFLDLHRDGWMTLPAVQADSKKGTETQVLEDGSLLFSGKVQKGDELTVTALPAPGRLASLRVEVLPDASHHDSVAREGRKQFELHVVAALRHAGKSKETNLPFYHAKADHHKNRYTQGTPIIGVQDRWDSREEDAAVAQTGVFFLAEPVAIRTGDTLIVKLRSDAVGRVRLAASPLAAPASEKPFDPKAVRSALAAKADDRSRDQVALLDRAYFLSGLPDQAQFDAFKKLQISILECRGGKAFTMVTQARPEPLEVRVLPRGNWMDKSGEIVQPSPPGFLFDDASCQGRRMTRLDLAHWLVARDNPLTARNFMNRLWKEFFGTGISAKLDDLGSQGEWPTHPRLLDWLAVEFMDSGWNVKHMVKLLVQSRTYRQSSNPKPALIEADPYNRLYARMTPRRLQAEFVRDNALAISGLLNPDLGGPSVHPYQPAGYYEHLNFPKRDYESDTDDRQYRRGVYMHWQRTFLHPMLANFDAPSREECTADRTVSNSPQQALTLLNDPTFVECSRALAASLLKQDSTTNFQARLDEAYERALARPPTAQERRSLREFFKEQTDHLQSESQVESGRDEADKLIRIGNSPTPETLDATEWAAWTEVCRVILNLHETITRY